MGREGLRRRLVTLLLAGALVVAAPLAGAEVHDDHPHEVGASIEGFDQHGASGTVYRLYRAYFLRDPDAGGFAYWLHVHEQGIALSAISEEFARSAEFVRTYGPLSDLQFVERVYRNVLGRAPDAGGYAYWTDLMQRGLRRGELMIAFSDSPEFRTRTAAERTSRDDPTAYLILGRGPDGQPLRWNPCRPVRVATNLIAAPAGAEAVVQAAVDRLAQATDVAWTYVGTTSARANDHAASDPMSVQTPDAEVVVSWPAEWGTAAAGMGGAAWEQTAAGDVWYVRGSVQLDQDLGISSAEMLHLVMHELGHVAGLGHPTTSGQVMSSDGRLGLSEFRAGDRAGLAVVGRGTTTC